MVTELVTLTYPVVEILKINVTPLKCFFKLCTFPHTAKTAPMSDLQMCPVMSGTGIFAADDLDYAVAELAFILFQHPIDAFRVFVDW